jgi:hypothetical protein
LGNGFPILLFQGSASIQEENGKDEKGKDGNRDQAEPECRQDSCSPEWEVRGRLHGRLRNGFANR